MSISQFETKKEKKKEKLPFYSFGVLIAETIFDSQAHTGRNLLQARKG